MLFNAGVSIDKQHNSLSPSDYLKILATNEMMISLSSDLRFVG